MKATHKRSLAAGIATLTGLITLGPLASAHPAVEGGMKTPFAGVKGFAGSNIEFVADPGMNELRIYVSESEDGKSADGKKWEWVINMPVRTAEIKTAGGNNAEVSLLPLRDPGPGKEWFPVAPVERKNGYAFYRAEVAARVLLDADPAKRHNVIFKAGEGPHGRRCFKTALNLAGAKTLRLEEVKVSVLDAGGNKEPWTKIYFQQAFGLGLIAMKKADKVAEVDMPLRVYAESIAKVSEAAKFRKPEAPAL